MSITHVHGLTHAPPVNIYHVRTRPYPSHPYLSHTCLDIPFPTTRTYRVRARPYLTPPIHTYNRAYPVSPTPSIPITYPLPYHVLPLPSHPLISQTCRAAPLHSHPCISPTYVTLPLPSMSITYMSRYTLPSHPYLSRMCPTLPLPPLLSQTCSI